MKTMPSLTPLKALRRDKILNIAEHVFVAQGYRAVTMEAVADAVGMSRVTVYGYFKDKDALFTAVATRLATRLETAVTDALAEKTTLAHRIANALVAKHEIVFDVVRSSAFSTELFIAKDRVVAEIFATLDAKIEKQIARLLQKGSFTTAEAKVMAQLLFGASQGIANHTTSKAEASSAMRIMVLKMLS
jgi:AcrR family transcriptional regulator